MPRSGNRHSVLAPFAGSRQRGTKTQKGVALFTPSDAGRAFNGVDRVTESGEKDT
jgi:hypothetical protein